MLAAIALPGAGFTQAAQPPPQDPESRIAEQIREKQAQTGIHSPSLVDPLTALALLYQEDGDHGLAVETIERARQVVRVNFGLYSLEEAPLLRQLIYSEEARGNVEAAWDLEQELLTLIERHPDDLRTVPMLRAIAGKRMEVLERYIEGEFPPQIVLGCYYGKHVHDISDPRRYENPRCHSGRMAVVIGSLLEEAQSYYAKAIDILLHAGRPSSDELAALEMEVVRNSYRYRGYRIRAYFDGRKVLQRSVAYGRIESDAPLDRASRLVRLADWDIVFADDFLLIGDYAAVLALYEQAYRQLATENVEQAAIDEIFSPSTPVVLPAFLPNPLIAEEISEPAEYIDVAFDITKYGKSENVEILDATANVARAAERDLVRLIKRSRFRPRLTDGRFEDLSPVIVRYRVR